mgnify:FL=1|jgi:uncharacterized RmlC-like cupin family protein
MRAAWFALTSVIAVAGCAHTPSASNAWTTGPTFAPMAAATATGAFAATLDGSTTKAAPYTIRVHITKGGKILPHTHPDPRVITVVDGNLCYGFGEAFDPEACTMYPEGSYFLVPGNVPHYGYGKEDAVYQESGVGPSAFVLVPTK